MIVVIGRVQTDPERREALIELAQTLARASRQEAGCIGYRFYEDTEQANAFVFIEEWESNEALQRHFGTDQIRAFMAKVPAVLSAPPVVHFHSVASTMDLADMRRR